MYCITEPGSSPDKFHANFTSTQTFKLQWKLPKTPNGVITQYQVYCTDGEQILEHTLNGSQTTITLSGLLSYTNYSCSITAHTSVGGGPAATTIVTTEQDGK